MTFMADLALDIKNQSINRNMFGELIYKTSHTVVDAKHITDLNFLAKPFAVEIHRDLVYFTKWIK